MDNMALHSNGGVSSRLFQNLVVVFPKVTGLRLKILSSVAWMDAVQEDPQPHPFCKAMASNPKGCVFCQQAQVQLRRCGCPQPQPCEVKCFTGLTKLAVPVIVAEKHLATLVAGPMHTARPPANALKTLVSELQMPTEEAGRANVEQAFWQIPVLTPDQRSATQQIMTLFAAGLAASLTPESPPPLDRFEPV